MFLNQWVRLSDVCELWQGVLRSQELGQELGGEVIVNSGSVMLHTTNAPKQRSVTPSVAPQ